MLITLILEDPGARILISHLLLRSASLILEDPDQAPGVIPYKK